ncbi:hypothetical protein CONPUDRAFT_146906 [Coniophora puteana RWD-64-598 SS2]|uniref:F-box domain-containing protein n=1 Tax=Coniophora puteana (strain RWD-64-598) TaxID=741705 RepID=A0A5M3MAU4_CONPW|nr:uncharacterized protein CONPUDRAFT_146906 [Coniophora puteana RWD-64-598 SS2]EIW75761.1 hypothetical protein CONPUDRAFT_146906 [Coniophora puteana RWD-64-598 SS2]
MSSNTRQGDLASQMTCLSLQSEAPNTLCSHPIAQLPGETLIVIFGSAIWQNDSLRLRAASSSSAIYTHPYVFTLAQLVISTSSLWSLVSYRARAWYPKLVNLQIERSGLCPLQVMFIAPAIEEESDLEEEVSTANAFVSLISPLVSRFEAVHFDVYEYRSFKSIIGLLNSHGAPLLQEIDIVVSTAPASFAVSSHLQMDWTNDEVTATERTGSTHPFLRSVSLHDLYPVLVAAHTLTNVTHVQLSFTASHRHWHKYEPDFPHIIQFLKGLPRIEDVFFESDAFYQHPPESDPAVKFLYRADLPNLRTFTWKDALPCSVATVMDSLFAPRLETLKLAVVKQRYSTTDNGSASVCMPSLKELYVECTDKKGLESALCALDLPSLERLEVTHVPFPLSKSMIIAEPAPPVFPHITYLFNVPCLQNLTHLSICGFTISKSRLITRGDYGFIYTPSLQCLSLIECTRASGLLAELAESNDSINVGVKVCPRLREVTIAGCADVSREDIERLLRSRSQRCQREEIQKIVQSKGDAQQMALLGRKIVPLRRPKGASPGATIHGMPTSPSAAPKAEDPNYEAFVPVQLEKLYIDGCEMVTEDDVFELEDMEFGTAMFYW